MKIAFHGADRTVTGSCHRIECNGKNILIDCGMYQGERELTEENTELLKMRFKHFQDLEGVVQLPEGFTPRKMIVEIKPNSKKLPPVKERFDWTVTG